MTKKALKLGATSVDYSNRKNSKYFVTLKDGKKVQFGSPKYPDFLIRQGEERIGDTLRELRKLKTNRVS